MPKVTIKDIAKKAGVAFQTVSKVLNDNAPTVSPATCERVKKIAREMGYTPNMFARSLRKGSTGIIGITYSGLRQLMQFDDPYLSQVYNGVGKTLTEKRYKLMFHSVLPDGGDLQSIELAEQHLLDGLVYILMSAAEKVFDATIYEHLKKLPVPVVVVHSTPRRFDVPSVGFDFADCAHTAVTHLLDHGYASAGLILPWSADQVPLYRQLEKGYREVLEGSGIPVQPDHLLVAGGNTLAHGRQCAEQAVKMTSRPQAWFVVGDGVVNGFRQGMEQGGLRVPEDAAVVGFSDMETMPFHYTDITTVSQPSLEKGEKAGEMLLAMLEKGGASVGTDTVVFDPVLKTRGSCGCARSGKALANND